MVLESILSAKAAENNILFDFAYGVLMTLASFTAAFFLFPAISSMLAVVLLSIGIVPVLLKIFYFEDSRRKLGFFETHARALRFFLVFFLAVSLTVTALHHWLPAGVSDQLFAEETREIGAISSGFSTGRFLGGATGLIVKNNLIVLFSSFVLAFVLGGGAAFVLCWNAMVFGVFLSMALAKGNGAFILSLAYALPELFSYYVGGLSGGLLSTETSAFLTRRKKNLSPSIVTNAIILLSFAAAVIVVMGVLEAIIIS